VTATEFIFLALGLVLGVAAGAALLEVLRARPPVPREVRVVVSQDAIPRRSATLSDDAFMSARARPARGGPADRRLEDQPMSDRALDHRTTVRSGVGAMTDQDDDDTMWPRPGRTMEPIFPLSDPRGAPSNGVMVGISVGGGDDPMLAALHASGRILVPTTVASVVASGQKERGPQNDSGLFVGGTSGGGSGAAEPQGLGGPGGGGSGAGAPAEASGGGAAVGPVGESIDACAAERRMAAERCGFAVGARGRATEAAEGLRVAQRTYDDHINAADAAAAIADARGVRREKEAAQARFRASYNGSKSTEDAEAAARDWLVDINDVNTTARNAAITAKRERAAAAAIGAGLESLTRDADAARIAAEAAEAACLVARQSLAECDEGVAAGVAVPLPQAAWSERPTGQINENEPLAAALSAGGTPTIFRLLRGDPATLTALVARLARDDAAASRRWQANLTQLVDAIVAVSIESGSLEFPGDHPFWGLFTLAQDREITQALASLGHRFDGSGGFVDERVPTQRELSMAMGYAGLDPMRIRQWPTEAEMAALFSDLSVAADEHLAATAGDLSLSDLIALLGRRADGLADLWNDWGTIRPLLLEGA
jgi:hypothetical protein